MQLCGGITVVASSVLQYNASGQTRFLKVEDGTMTCNTRIIKENSAALVRVSWSQQAGRQGQRVEPRHFTLETRVSLFRKKRPRTGFTVFAMGVMFESFYLELLTVVVVLVTTLYWYFTSTFNYWKDRGVPFLKPEPFFGNFRNIIFLRRALGEEFMRLYKKTEGLDYFGVFQSRNPALIIRSPELIKHVLVKDFAHFHDRGMPFNEKVDPLSAHLFNLEGTRWKNLRAKLTPTFTSGKIKAMFHVLNECGVELKSYLDEPAKNGEDIEIKEVLAKFTTDIIGTCAFGLQFNSMKDADSEFRNMGRRIFTPTFGGSARRILLTFFPGLSKSLNMTFLPVDIKDFFLNAVKETVKFREDNHVVRPDFMDLMIQLKNKGSVSEDNDAPNKKGTDDVHVQTNGKVDVHLDVTDEVIAAQAFVFFLAGFETSSTTMSFCLYELAQHPDIQEKLRAEVKSCTEETGGELTYEAMSKMKYLEQAVSETLRKFPPVGNLIRRCTKTYTLPGTDIQIEKGMRVFIPVFAIHRDPQYYPDPEAFQPERFSEEEEKKRPGYTYMPFGEGPRVCIGLRFGMLQTKVGLAVILANYRVSLSKKTPVPLVLNPKAFITAAVGDMWLKLEPIS